MILYVVRKAATGNMQIKILINENIKFISDLKLDLFRATCPSFIALVAAVL